jgi:two-component system LytT family response regulator
MRVVVVDDEPVALHGLASLLKSAVDVDFVAECSDGRAAIDAIRSLAPDVVFLDVQMPEIDGFSVVQEIGVDRMPAVIFVTAFDQFAIRAFDVSAVDYLLKPFSDERAFSALEKARRSVALRTVEEARGRLATLLSELAPTGSRNSAETEQSRFIIREHSRTYAVPIPTVDWIEGADYYVKLHVAEKVHLLREPMTSLAKRLNPRQFYRLHRSAIVNLTRVREIKMSAGEPTVVLLDGTRLRVTRGRRAELERLLEFAAP